MTRAAVEKGETMEYEIKPLTPEEAEYIGGKLEEYVRSVAPSGPAAEEEEIVLKIEDGQGNIIAGCVIDLHEWGWDRMLLATLWVDARCRGQGLGSQLIHEAERIGREKDCYISCLGTMVFHARGLYEKHGYTVFTTRKDYPRGKEGYSLAKRLDRGIPDYVPQHNGAEGKYEVRRGTEEDAEVICDGLGRYSDQFAPDLHEKIRIDRKLADADGRLIAGILASVGGWDEFSVDVLWVEEPYRGQGLGSLLLREAEREGIARGAYKLFTSAGDWNAGFFEKNGYAAIGELKDVPRGHSCYEMEKPVRPEDAAGCIE